MHKIWNNMKGVVITAAMMISVNLAAIWGLAYAVYCDVPASDTSDVLLVLMMIVGSAIAGYVGSGFNNGYAWMYLAGFFALLCEWCVLRVFGCELYLSGVMKALIATFVGLFIGIFIKNFIHNKLRKNKKIRREYTK